MNKNIFKIINDFIEQNKILEAQTEISKLGSEYHKDPEYLYIRGKLFYMDKLFYAAIDTLLIALEFGEDDKIFNLLSKIYDQLENKELSRKISDLSLRKQTINFLKKELSGIFRK